MLWVQKMNNIRNAAMEVVSNTACLFGTCYDIISMRTRTFKERRYICGETAVKQRGKY